MQKMAKENIIIEVKNEDIEKAKELGFKIYNGLKMPNAEVDLDG